MKRFLLTTIILFFTLSLPAMGEEQKLSTELLEEIESKALRHYFNALKSGNMQLLMRYTSGKKKEKIQGKLNREKEYSQYLRKLYKDAVFSVVDGVATNEGVIVTVHVELPEEETLGFRFRLQKQDVGSKQENWLITEEPNIPAE